jgi:tetratricopeptide (TPR) repeat protein
LNESSPGRIFISYRRQETAWPAGRLYDVLVEHFPAEQVFKDVDNIEPGEDFVERITAAVGSCDVLLVLIGPQWLTITDETGRPRLDDPEDFVRLEIETALNRKIRVIPILVDGAHMPRANELPPALASLIRRNAVEINPLTFDTKRLIATVHKTLADLKVADTATGSASATSRARADRTSQQVAEPDVEQLYDQALGAFWTEQWDKAVSLLGQVLSRQPDYADAVRKLELARHQQELAMRYAEASAAADEGDWEQAVAGYSMVAEADPNYRDTNARLAQARQQHQVASLLGEAHRLHRAGQWAAVIKVGEQLQAIDRNIGDPDGLIAAARVELAAEQQTAKIAAEYHTALRLFDARRWEEAVEALERVTRVDSTYQHAPALLDRARRELRQATAEQAEEQARGRADEHARRLDEVQAWQLAEVQAWRKAEEQARREALSPTSANDKSKQTEDSIPPGPPTQSEQKVTRLDRVPNADRVDLPKQRRKSYRFLMSLLICIAIAIFIPIAIAVQKNIESKTPLPNGTQVFSDNFSSPALWQNQRGGGGYYLNGAYIVRANPKSSWWAFPQGSNVYPKADSNLRIDAEGRAVQGAGQGRYGIACRVKDRDFYAFEISETGSVNISKVAGEWTQLNWSSTSLVSNNGTNKLQVTCSSPEGQESKEVDLAIWVGGKKVLDAKDTNSPLTDGGVALLADANGNEPVEAQFDNFSVYTI